MIISSKPFKIKTAGYIIAAFTVFIGTLVLLFNDSSDTFYLSMNTIGCGIFFATLTYFVLPNLYQVEWENDIVIVSDKKVKIEIKIDDISYIESRFSFVNSILRSSTIFILHLKKATIFGNTIAFKSKSESIIEINQDIKQVNKLRYLISKINVSQRTAKKSVRRRY